MTDGVNRVGYRREEKTDEALPVGKFSASADDMILFRLFGYI